MNDNENLIAIINELPEQRIPVERIKKNSYNKNVMAGVYFQTLLESLKTFGQVYPIIVREVDGEYVIIDGEHRWRGLMEVGILDAVCKVAPFTDDEARLFTIHINKMRGKTTEIGERQVIEPIRDRLTKFNIEALTMLPPLMSPPPKGEYYNPPPPMNLDVSVSKEPSLVGQVEPEAQSAPQQEALPPRVSPFESTAISSPRTVSIPFFFSQEDYDYLMSMTMRVKEKFKLASREESFMMVAKMGENAMTLETENKKLKEKFEKLEIEKEQKRVEREDKKIKKIKEAIDAEGAKE